MAKEAYYFSHDSNARNDPKILRMRRVYKSEGYGWYWALVEMLRDEEEYKMQMHDGCNALAMQMQCEENAAEKYLHDCINTFELFDSDGEYFWSNSLIRRMEKKEEKSEKARQAALSRWDKKPDANAMQTQCKRNAIKGKEKKVNKKEYAPHVTLTEDEHVKLSVQHGQADTLKLIEILSNYKAATGKRYKSDYHAILNWVVKRLAEDRQKPQQQAQKKDPLPAAYQPYIDEKPPDPAQIEKGRAVLQELKNNIGRPIP